MKLRFFTNGIETVDELKGQYKKLAFKHHPDKGGDLESMQIINAEYDYLCGCLAGKEYTCKSAKGKEYTKTNENIEMLKHYKNIIEELLKVDGIKIELVGTWLWVSDEVEGTTKENKDLLKGLKFYWNKVRQVWQFNPDKLNPDYVQRRGRKSNLDTDTLKDVFGYEGITGNYKKKRDFEPLPE